MKRRWQIDDRAFHDQGETLMAAMSDYSKMFINGEWVPAFSGCTRDIVNPATGEVIAVVAEGGLEDVKERR